MLKHLPIFVLALALFACAANQAAVPPEPVSLSAVRSGSDVTLTLRNDSGSEVQYNLCSSALQKSVAGGWEEVQTGDVCTMELRGLQPGQTATFVKSLPSALARGEYRYATRVHGDAARDLVSNSFNLP